MARRRTAARPSPELDARVRTPNINTIEIPANATSVSACKRLITHPNIPLELPSLIEEILSNEEGAETIPFFPKAEAQMFIDKIDETLRMADLPSGTQKRCLKLLYHTCGHHGLLPKALWVEFDYDRTREERYRGGYADVWMGKHCDRGVAVKVIRTYQNDELQTITKRFCKEAVMWRFLQHPNILPLIGASMSGDRFVMVSDWMSNGNINEFIKAHPDANRLRLLEGVANGLIYLHEDGMVHGDLKGANVLIDEACNARLADFGLLTIIPDSINILSSSSNTRGGTVRWMSPELIAPDRFGIKKSRPTESSDCYAFGMVIYETISGKLPFHESGDLTVSLKVIEGERPRREAIFTNNLWKMLKECWASDPNGRPSVGDVLRRLKVVLSPLGPSSPGYEEIRERNDFWERNNSWGSNNSWESNSSRESDDSQAQANPSDRVGTAEASSPGNPPPTNPLQFGGPNFGNGTTRKDSRTDQTIFLHSFRQVSSRDYASALDGDYRDTVDPEFLASASDSRYKNRVQKFWNYCTAALTFLFNSIGRFLNIPVGSLLSWFASSLCILLFNIVHHFVLFHQARDAMLVTMSMGDNHLRYAWHPIFNIIFFPLRLFSTVITWFVVLFQLSLTVVQIRVVLGWLGWPGAGGIALPILSFVLLVILVLYYADLESPPTVHPQGEDIFSNFVFQSIFSAKLFM